MTHRRLSGPWLGVAIAATGLFLALLLARLVAGRDPLRRAWSAALSAGAYTVAGTTHAQAGRLVAAYALSGTGATDGYLHLAVQAVNARSITTTYDIAWPDVAASPAAVVEPHALALILPVGDPLTLLASAHAPVAGALEPVGERDCRRVDFLVGGRAYAKWWSSHRRYLPANADSGGLNTLTGTGTLWLDPQTGRPCRIAARLNLPRLAGEQPGVGEVDWTYSLWGAAAPLAP